MTNFKLNRYLNAKRALSTPIGNLIILLAAVALCATVVVFAVALTTNQVQKEKVYVATTHVWYVNPSTSIAAIALTDTGPTDVVLTTINVKGLQCEWNGTDNYVVYCSINGTMPGDLVYPGAFANTGATVNIGGSSYDFTMASQGLTIRAGCSIAFYITVPNRVMMYDMSEPLRMVIGSTQSVYCTETLAQAAP